MKPLLIVSVLALASLSSAFAPGLRRDGEAQGRTQTFVGTITDEMCATGAGHASMRMGPTDAECTTACVAAHGAEYVLADGKNVYTLSDQKTPEKFAAKKVRVTGTLDATTKKIQVASMTLTQ